MLKSLLPQLGFIAVLAAFPALAEEAKIVASDFHFRPR